MNPQNAIIEETLRVLIRATLESGSQGVKWLWRYLRQRIELPGDRREMLSHLLLGRGDYLFHPALDYVPTTGQSVPPPAGLGYPHDLEALRAFIPLLPEKAFLHTNLLFEEHLTPTRRLVCAGSPKVNEVVRRYLPSYKVTSKGVSLQYDTILPPEAVPYAFGEDLEARRVKAISKMRGGFPDEKTRKLVWRRLPNGSLHPWTPKGYEDSDWLSKDFLLVSRLPRNNVGGDILILAGGHGAGTEATTLLFDKLPITQLRDLVDTIGNAPYYQFVVEVQKMEHRKDGTVARHICISDELPPIVVDIDKPTQDQEVSYTREGQ